MKEIRIVDAKMRGMDTGAICENEDGQQICHLPCSIEEAAEEMRAEYPEANVVIETE